MRKLEWIESEGGPLLLAPRSRLRDWSGIDVRESESQSDYDRACAITDEVGIISIGDGSAVVLGDMPDRTALVTEHAATDVFIVRWRCAASEESLLAALFADSSIQRLPYADACWMATGAEEYMLFDSAYNGAEIERYLSVSLQAGGYSIETCEFKPDKATNAVVHRMQLDLTGGKH